MRQSSSLTRIAGRTPGGSWSTKQNRQWLQHMRTPDIIGVSKFMPSGSYSPFLQTASRRSPPRSSSARTRRLADSA